MNTDESETKPVEETRRNQEEDLLKIEYTKEELIAGYQGSIDQNRLYAEFRWTIFSYISTLQAGLFYLVINSKELIYRIVCFIIGIAISLFLWLLEKRHHQLFTQSRESGKLFEKALGIEKLGVFNNQLNQKGGIGHSKLVFFITILTTLIWSIALIYSLFICFC